jgi:FlaA1/EpsC-like NDP-sugar epimerase
MWNKKRIIIFLIDCFLIISAFLIAFFLRFEHHIPVAAWGLLFTGIIVVIIVKPLVFISMGLHNTLWRYSSIHDMLRIFNIVTVSSILSSFIAALILISRSGFYSYSIFLLDWALLLLLVGASRMALRIYSERSTALRSLNSGRKTLIIGAGDAGNLLLKEIRKSKHTSYNIIGFVDDDPDKQRMLLNGVPVVGRIERLKSIVRKYNIEEVILAIPSAKKEVIRKVVNGCEKANVRFKTLPSLTDIIDNKISISQIKDVEIEDLLGRDPVVLDEACISHYLRGKKVLISGAAGSIGSEICRQVAKFSPVKMILIDNAETPLYYIEKELIEKHRNQKIIPILCDIRRTERIAQVFNEFSPDVVFHAAAYKHVPMMEYNPMEAISNNVKGTKILADAAHRCRVSNFVMISTDKAVNPTNVMGASKRVAEMYIQSMAEKSTTRFTTVRFGNVLGSNGSVIPLFKEQIKKGGPVTVTHPKVIRYFMTIPEACQLVLQAGCMGNGGDILVLDMGEPVRILDLAKELILLSGLQPNEDIEIVFTGLRPGEKLYEELLIEGEGIKPTRHEKIRVLEAVDIMMSDFSKEMEELFKASESANISGILKSLKLMVPEFSPNYSFSGEPPISFRRLRPDLFPVENIQPVSNIND